MNIGCYLLNNIDYISKLKENNFKIKFFEKEYRDRDLEKYESPNRKDPELDKTIFLTLYHNKNIRIKDIKLILIYFHGRGRGQIIRKIITKMGLSFLDIELPSETLWSDYFKSSENNFTFSISR